MLVSVGGGLQKLFRSGSGLEIDEMNASSNTDRVKSREEPFSDSCLAPGGSCGGGVAGTEPETWHDTGIYGGRERLQYSVK